MCYGLVTMEVSFSRYMLTASMLNSADIDIYIHVYIPRKSMIDEHQNSIKYFV